MTNIDIFARVRKGYLECESFNNKDVIYISNQKKNHKFNLKQYWKEGTSNNQIFDNLIDLSINYQHVFWLAFGYTGSGKTYTTESLIQELLYLYEDLTLKVSCFQILNNSIFDILNNNIQLEYLKTNILNIKNLTEKNISTNSINKLLLLIKKSRSTASTTSNTCSSRSHLFIQIKVDNKIYTIVDLAGQEFGKTAMENSKKIQSNGSKINLHLLSLKECIRATVDGQSHIPFRRSILTMALKPMFTNKCYAAIICTIYPKFIHQTIDTLKYAASIQNTNNIIPTLNEGFTDYADYINKSKKIQNKELQILNKISSTGIIPVDEIRNTIKQRLNLLFKIQRRLEDCHKKPKYKKNIKHAWDNDTEISYSLSEDLSSDKSDDYEMILDNNKFKNK